MKITIADDITFNDVKIIPVLNTISIAIYKDGQIIQSVSISKRTLQKVLPLLEALCEYKDEYDNH